VTIILAVDPGGTSGWVTADVSSTEHLRRTLIAGELDPVGMAEKLRLWCLDARTHGQAQSLKFVLVMERFTITAVTGKLSPQYDAMELIGLGKYLASWSGVEFDLSQAPGDAKAFAHNDQLKKWGVWVPAKEHARDAVRHLCLAAAKRGVYLQ
jgi:hypothetical protein